MKQTKIEKIFIVGFIAFISLMIYIMSTKDYGNKGSVLPVDTTVETIATSKYVRVYTKPYKNGVLVWNSKGGMVYIPKSLAEIMKEIHESENE